MWLWDNENKVFSIFLSQRQTAVDISDSYTGMQGFIKTFESGLVEYEQIFRACVSFSYTLSPCEEKFISLNEPADYGGGQEFRVLF